MANIKLIVASKFTSVSYPFLFSGENFGECFIHIHIHRPADLASHCENFVSSYLLSQQLSGSTRAAKSIPGTVQCTVCSV